MSIQRLLALLFVMTSIVGCSDLFVGRNSAGGGMKMSEVNRVEDAAKKFKVRMSRKVLESALKSGSVDDIRIVRLQRSTQTLARVGLPEYRIFSLREKGPYRALGLQNGDVLVAVEDYVVFEPWRFKRYVQVLPTQDSAQIEIRRHGRPVVLEYTFFD